MLAVLELTPAVTAASASASTFTWTANTSTDWNVATNWLDNGSTASHIPTSGDAAAGAGGSRSNPRDEPR